MRDNPQAVIGTALEADRNDWSECYPVVDVNEIINGVVSALHCVRVGRTFEGNVFAGLGGGAYSPALDAFVIE